MVNRGGGVPPLGAAEMAAGVSFLGFAPDLAMNVTSAGGEPQDSQQELGGAVALFCSDAKFRRVSSQVCPLAQILVVSSRSAR